MRPAIERLQKLLDENTYFYEFTKNLFDLIYPEGVGYKATLGKKVRITYYQMHGWKDEIGLLNKHLNSQPPELVLLADQFMLNSDEVLTNEERAQLVEMGKLLEESIANAMIDYENVSQQMVALLSEDMTEETVHKIKELNHTAVHILRAQKAYSKKLSDEHPTFSMVRDPPLTAPVVAILLKNKLPVPTVFEEFMEDLFQTDGNRYNHRFPQTIRDIILTETILNDWREVYIDKLVELEELMKKIPANEAEMIRNNFTTSRILTKLESTVYGIGLKGATELETEKRKTFHQQLIFNEMRRAQYPTFTNAQRFIKFKMKCNEELQGILDSIQKQIAEGASELARAQEKEDKIKTIMHEIQAAHSAPTILFKLNELNQNNKHGEQIDLPILDRTLNDLINEITQIAADNKAEIAAFVPR